MKNCYTLTPLQSRHTVFKKCWDTIRLSTERNTTVSQLSPPQPRQGQGMVWWDRQKGAVSDGGGKQALGWAPVGWLARLSWLLHEPSGPLEPCPDHCCGPAAPLWWRPAQIPFHQILTLVQETAGPGKKKHNTTRNIYIYNLCMSCNLTVLGK